MNKQETFTYCTKCNKLIKRDKTVHLAYDARLDLYTNGNVPDEDQQGAFPFGDACAKTVLKNGGKI